MEAEMKKAACTVFAAVITLSLMCTPMAWAHFGMLIPSDSMVMGGDQRTLILTLSFSHPFEGIGMELVKPKAFYVATQKDRTDLSKGLKEITVMSQPAWECRYQIKRPGIYAFLMEPQPYWEPAEDCFIIHYTKTVVTAFGDDENWDAELGLKTEIVPLSKPFGLYTGNVFQGIVKLGGKVVPFAEVEVEYFNEGNKALAPTDYMVTQTIKADKNGVFTYAVPCAGWWGFAALNSADFKLQHAGEDKDVELGAVIWVKFHPWQEK
jgi:cobalt/nickel transport protein